MKKLFAIFFIVLCLNAKNINAYVYDKTANKYTLDYTYSYRADYYHDVGIKNRPDSQVGMYDGYVNGKLDGIFICYSPDKNANGTYKTLTEINLDSPAATTKNMRAFFASSIKAYQILVEKGIIKAGKTIPLSKWNSSAVKERHLLLLIIRWLASKYGVLDTGGTSHNNNYLKYVYKDRYDKWDLGNSTVKSADEIVKMATKVGDKVLNKDFTNTQLIEKGLIWGAQWTTSAPTITVNKDNPYIVRVEFDLSAKGKIDKINYDKFKVTCSYGYTCDNVRTSKSVKNGTTTVHYKIDVNTENAKKNQAQKAGKPYGLEIKTNFYDLRDSSHLFMMTPKYSSAQKMFLIRNYNKDLEIVTNITPEWEDTCTCQVNKNGEFTKKYEYQSYSNGEYKTEVFSLLDTEKAEKYNCPSAKKCGLVTTCKCDYDTNNQFTNKYVVTETVNKNTATKRFPVTNTEKAELYNCPSADTCVKASCSCEFKDDVFTGNFVVKEKVNGETKKTTIPATDKEAAKQYGCPDVSSCGECTCETDNKGNFTGNYLYYKNGVLFDTFKLDDQTKSTKYNCPSAESCANDCFCQVDENNEYTEKYQYNKYENGVLTVEEFEFDDPRAQQYNCPSSKKCHPEHNECTFDEESNTFFGKDGTEVTKQEYVSQCVKSCKVETNAKGKDTYYCPSGDELVSGRECTAEEYEDECLCLPLKNKCIDGDNEACDEYQTKCLQITEPKSCSAKVTIPDECADFATDLDSSTLQGEVDDLNKDPSCGNNTVKKCIIDGVDQAGNSYEMMSNSYCSVWCKESYKFDLPTARHSRSGGYFTLEAAVSGERECYATGNDNPSGPIDEAKFHKDLEKTEEDLQKAYDDYIEAKEDKEKAEELLETLKAEVPSAESSVSSAQSALSSAESELSSAQSALTNAQNALSAVPAEDEAGKASAEAGVASAEAAVTSASTNVSNAESSLSSAETYLSDLKDRISSTEDRIEYDQQKMDENEALMNSLNNKIQSLFGEYNGCASWGVGFKFDPKIDYWYNERYMDILTNDNSGTFEADGTTSRGGMDEYCKGDTNEDFECQSEKTDRVQEKDQDYKYCTIEGCESRTRKMNDVLWVRKNETAANSYRPHANFSTSIGFGTIKRNAPECNGRDCLFTKLPINALPVELSTGRGVFPFVLQFRNIGQYNKTGEMGRIMGAEKSVVTSLPKADSMCSTPGYHATMNASYVCQYINDCSDCETQCINCGDDPYEPEDPYEPPEIPDPECEGETCPLTCVSCIYDGDKTQYNFRTVSVNNVFPNSCNKAISNCRAEGYNWDKSNPKAKKTLSEIEEKAEEIYQEPEYSYTLNPGQLQSIRKYNEKAGSYLNTTIPETGETALKCERLDINGKLYNVKCTSSFLDTDSQTYFSEQKRNTEFTLWDTKDVDEYAAIGPSWK